MFSCFKFYLTSSLRRIFTVKGLAVLLVVAYICFGLKSTIFFEKHRAWHEKKLHYVNFRGYFDDEGKILIESPACRVPTLEVNSSEILKLLKKSTLAIQCNKTKDWVQVLGSLAKIGSWVKEVYGPVRCNFMDVIRDTDYKQHYESGKISDTEYILEKSDVVDVRCVSHEGKTWNKTLIGIRRDPNISDRSDWSKIPSDGLGLNVLMFGIDSMSHNMWKRRLPITYAYATETLNGIALNGYNIVGDGTPQALIPILTGRTELELPDTRKRMGNKAQFVNVYPFIWNEFAKNGYVTAYGEDLENVGTFTYRLKGFNETPVDHYMRPFYMEAIRQYKAHPPYCYGSLTRLEILMSLMKNMYEVYPNRPKFTFAFHGELSHENNDLIGSADDEIEEWLRDFDYKGYLNDTLLILMSDHGSRYAALRNTQQGKQEERLPGFIFVFPPWFPQKYPQAYANFKENADRLSTPFDIYPTLYDVLHFGGTPPGNLTTRSISLFKKIPMSRTCRDAFIEPHWCTCLDWEEILVTDPVAEKAFQFFVDFINRETEENRRLCAKLSLDNPVWVARLRPNKILLSFKESSDRDGFRPNLSGKMKASKEIYQIKVILAPGQMNYEASISYLRKEDKFNLKLSDISRIDKYRRMTHCIEDAGILHNLRKYCNCLNNNNSNSYSNKDQFFTT